MVGGPRAKHRRWKIPNCANVLVTGPQVLDSKLIASVGGEVANCPHWGPMVPDGVHLRARRGLASRIDDFTRDYTWLGGVVWRLGKCD